MKLVNIKPRKHSKTKEEGGGEKGSKEEGRERDTHRRKTKNKFLLMDKDANFLTKDLQTKFRNVRLFIKSKCASSWRCKVGSTYANQ